MKNPKVSRLLWCRFCDWGYSALPGPLPDVCLNPDCDRPASWTTTPPWHLTRDDKAILKALHIRS
jgi:hypothetical protein